MLPEVWDELVRMFPQLAEAKIQGERRRKKALIHQYGIVGSLMGIALFIAGALYNEVALDLVGGFVLVSGFICWFFLSREHILTRKDWE